MIQPATLPVLPGLLPLGDVLAVPTVEGLETADFWALVAIESKGLAQPVVAPPLADVALPVLPEPLPEAAVLPESGKPLPVALPVAAIDKTAPLPRQAASEIASPAVAAPTSPAETPLRASRRLPAEPAASPERGDGEAPVQTEPRIAALLTQPLQAASALAAQVVSPPTEIATGAQAQLPGLPIQAPALAPFETCEALRPALARQSPPAALTPIEPRERPQIAQNATQLSPAAITLSVTVVPATHTPPIGEPQLRLTLPLAESAPVPQSAKPIVSRLRLPPMLPAAERRSAPGKAAAIVPAELAAPVAALATLAAPLAPPAVLSLPAPPAFAPADPALRPHDFTQLVDRLVAARELAAPQAFQVALQHGEFGPIQLRFRQEGEGLSVTLASIDPEFARVVSATPAPVLAAVPAETPTPTVQRFDSPSQNGANSGGSGQHRGAAPERREDRAGPEGNPAPARQGEGRDPRRGGIFA